jgi:CheY-like chemotaxis protein
VKNLVVNAFKFTNRGDVTVRFGPAEHGWHTTTTTLVDATAVLAISVADTGIGVEPDQQRRIFEPFAQVEGTPARLDGGTGLGLSLSRELAGLLGGEITLVSSPGEGSTFTVYLPVAGTATAPPRLTGALRALVEAAARDAAPVDASPPDVPVPLALTPIGLLTPDRRVYREFQNGGFDGMKILVVDDDYRNIFAMTALLERGGIKVIAAESGHDALAVLDRDPDIGIVLMDIMMPVMDGYAAMRAIRAIPRYTKVPIIAVTGKVMPGERERCLDAGADGYVPKPVDTRDMLAVLTPWLETASASTA